MAQGQPLKGPYLGTIAQTYKRAELAEAILYPNKTISQGFATNVFTLKDGSAHMGFVVKEGAENLQIRNIAGQEITLPTTSIASRTTDTRSMMPEGLLGNVSVKDFAGILDYLEHLAKEGKSAPKNENRSRPLTVDEGADAARKESPVCKSGECSRCAGRQSGNYDTWFWQSGPSLGPVRTGLIG